MPDGLPASLHSRLPMPAAATAAIAICWLLHPRLGDAPALILLPAAVTVAVWRGGTRAAAAVAVIGYVTADLLFLGGAGRLGPVDAAGWMLLVTYAVFCALVIGLGETTWRARFRAQSSRGSELAERRRAAEDRGALAAIVEASDDAIISKDLAGTIRSWNPGAERLFGYDAEEALGRSIRLIVPAELWEEEQNILRRLARGERVQHFDTVRLTKSGRRLHVSLTVSPIRDEHGNVIGASKIARDVTERKRAEAALRFSEERFRELADNIDQFAWTCDEQGNGNWYNRRWYDYTGATVDEMRRGDVRRFLDPEMADGVVARFRKCVASGEPWEDTFPLRGRDGRWRWFLSRAIPILDANGQVVRWFGTNTDVTEQRLLEQQLVAADRRKDEFLATLAHELRNPLAPIRNALEILNVAGDDTQLVTRAREIIARQTSHMVRLVDDLLEVSRITRDQLDLHRSAVELNAVVEQALDLQRPSLEEKSLELTVTMPPHPVTLHGDAVRLAQVVSNLLSNAIRYTPHGGRVEVIVEEAGAGIVLRVRDNGTGIPPDQLDAIFEMFTQVKDHHNVQGGLGVGLTLVKRLVELHGGTVTAHSPGPGQGSEFVVRLPTGSAQDADTAEAEPHPVPRSEPRRVLVVEDNPDTATTLAALLGLAGHETRVAEDGAMAVELAESFRPDVVLLDLGLPKMDGIEVCRWLRRQPWGRKLTVVALTGWGQESDRRRTLEAGFDEHLVKPVGPEAVLALVASVPRPAARALG